MRNSNCGFRNSELNSVLHASLHNHFIKFQIRNSKFSFGVWCNASIRVLGTRGDSSILSSPTKKELRIANCQLTNLSQSFDAITSANSFKIRNSLRIVGPVGSRHGVANAETPVRIRYDAPIQQFCPRSLTEERFASNESDMGSSPIGGSNLECGGKRSATPL